MDDRGDVSGGVGVRTDEEERLLVELGRLEGEVEALRERLAAADATEEHHRVELEAARTATAEARALAQEAQARAEQLQHRLDETRARLRDCEEERARAEREREAVIAALGRRARRRLHRSGDLPDDT